MTQATSILVASYQMHATDLIIQTCTLWRELSWMTQDRLKPKVKLNIKSNRIAFPDAHPTSLRTGSADITFTNYTRNFSDISHISVLPCVKDSSPEHNNNYYLVFFFSFFVCFVFVWSGFFLVANSTLPHFVSTLYCFCALACVRAACVCVCVCVRERERERERERRRERERERERERSKSLKRNFKLFDVQSPEQWCRSRDHGGKASGNIDHTCFDHGSCEISAAKRGRHPSTVPMCCTSNISRQTKHTAMEADKYSHVFFSMSLPALQAPRLAWKWHLRTTIGNGAYPTNPDRNKQKQVYQFLTRGTLTKSRQKRQNGKDHLKNSGQE